MNSNKDTTHTELDTFVETGAWLTNGWFMSKNVEFSIECYVYLLVKVIWLNVITVSILQLL